MYTYTYMQLHIHICNLWVKVEPGKASVRWNVFTIGVPLNVQVYVFFSFYFLFLGDNKH